MNTVTCHTGGCENDGIPLQLDLTAYDLETGEPIPGELCPVVCGPCGQPIDDVTEASSG